MGIFIGGQQPLMSQLNAFQGAIVIAITPGEV